MSKIEIEILSHGVGLELPSYATDGSAGFDLRAAVNEPITIQPMQRALIPLGFKVSFSPKYEIQVRSRSGLALKKGVMVLNSPGTVDSDYRGEMMVILANFGNEPFVVNRGDRIAQGLMVRVEKANFTKVVSVENTNRGEGGFGSTGVK